MALDHQRLDYFILRLADTFDIRVVCPSNSVLLSGALAVAGGVIGGYYGGKLGAVVGSGIGGAAVFVTVKLREMWVTVKEKLIELRYIVLNYLRRLNPDDIVRAFEILMACSASRRELVFTILEFIAQKLGREVISNLTCR